MGRFKRLCREAAYFFYIVLSFLSLKENLERSEVIRKSVLKESREVLILMPFMCGRSSVVEHHVANVRVVSSNLIAR